MTIEQANISLEALETKLQKARKAKDFSQIEDLSIAILKAKIAKLQ